eukprot:gene17200-23519_t
MGNNMSDLHKDAKNGELLALCFHLQSMSGKIDQQEDTYGWTALHIAAAKGYETIVRELLRREARTDVKDNSDQTPLHLACKEGHTQVVKDLLWYKANARLLDKSGKTPLDLVPLGAKHQTLRGLVSAAVSSTAALSRPAANASSQPGAGGPAEIATQMRATTLNSPHTQSPSSSPTAVGSPHASAPPQGGRSVPHGYPPQSYQAPPPDQQNPFNYPRVPSGSCVPPRFEAPQAPSAGPSWTHQQPTPLSSMPLAPGPHQAALRPPMQQGQHVPGSQVLSHPTSGPFQLPAAGQPPSPGPQAPRPPSSGGGWGDLFSPTSSQGSQYMQPAFAAYASHRQQQLEADNAFNQQTGQPMRPPPSQYTAAQEEDPSKGWKFWMPSKKKSSGGQSADSQAAVGGGVINSQIQSSQAFPHPPATSTSHLTQPPTTAAFTQPPNLQGAVMHPSAVAPLNSGSGGGWFDDGLSDWGEAIEQPHFSPAEDTVKKLECLSTLQMEQYRQPTAPQVAVQCPPQRQYIGTAGRKEYTYEELRACTGGFAESNKLGEGGFGPVYRGELDGIPVAIKVMDKGPDAMQGKKEFAAEVAILSQVRHPHIVLLIGSCPTEGTLVYELMSSGTLDAFLFPKPAAQLHGGMVPLTLWWQDRVRIASEVAAALLHLHSEPEDLKPSNILLDQNLTSKLGDYGLARLLTPDKAVHPHDHSANQASQLVGTIRYMDPEYLSRGEFSARSDVYALGIVMLQMLTGVDDKHVISMVEKSAGEWPVEEAIGFADLALKCVTVSRKDRPKIRNVVLPTLVQLRQRTLLYPKPSAQQQVPRMAVVDVSFPERFCCPITQEIMNDEIMDDPVVTADGFTYERLAIEEWITKKATSPFTNIPLTDVSLRPNLNLRSAIREWQQNHQRE